ncbi:MAG TPA: enoyl-CoA hydratase/isomerase family protein [Acidimicrobiia bacterium]|nr:enoyl-CoA hydratase/isomerase family protein [Acidimicrobiia bacterium]
MSDTLSLIIDGPVAEVTLTRPEVLNRFDFALHQDFTEMLLELRGQSDLRAVVLASTGKCFSAGGDFELMLAARADIATRTRMLDEGRLMFRLLIDVPLPIVVALQGDAIGLGATVALACDAIVASRTAAISDPHVAIGLVAGDGGCVVWPAAAGLLRAKRYLLTGDRLPAEEAWAMGLVTDLVDGPDDALPAARALAARMAALPPLAVQGTKRALNRLMQQRAGEVLDLSFALEGASMASDDLAEAIAAFKERREPKYQGR